MAPGQPRVLLVVADDFGIGPATTAGILHLAGKGVVTGTVLLVNSPYAEEAVGLWNRAGRIGAQTDREGTRVMTSWYRCRGRQNECSTACAWRDQNVR